MVQIRYPTNGDFSLADLEGDFNNAFDRSRGFRLEREGNEALGKYADWLTQQNGQPMSLASLGAPVGQVTRAPIGEVDPATARVQQAFEPNSGGLPSVGAMTSYIAQAAKARGIDPGVAVRVARSEGLAPNTWQSNVTKNGQRERSYGPFQLYTGGGLGNQFQQATGKDPSDPSTWQAGVDFALDHASKNGWGSWYGAANTGIGNWQGINRGAAPTGGQQALEGLAVGESMQMPPAQVADASGGMPQGQPATLLPPGDVMRALFANPNTKPFAISLAQAAMKMRQDQSDPQAQLEYRKALLQVQALERDANATNPGEFKVVGDRLVRISPDGSVSDATPQGQEQTGFRFSGNSVEAQALNGLMNSGAITPEQAQQLGAGKTVTGPNGEVMFLTPQGVFGQPANGGAPQPVDGNARGGVIPVTEPKVTIDEKKAATFADRMATSGDLIDQFAAAGQSTWNQGVRDNPLIPDLAENFMVSSDFQRFDQARRDFINAQLRRESGAVISEEEFDNANKQYLPMPGDGPEVLEQKRRNRQIVIEGMGRDAGPTYRGVRRSGATGKGDRVGSGWSDAGNGVRIRRKQ